MLMKFLKEKIKRIHNKVTPQRIVLLIKYSDFNRLFVVFYTSVYRGCFFLFIQFAALRLQCIVPFSWLSIGFAPSLGQSNLLPFVSFVIRVAPLLSHWLPSVLRAIQLAAQRFKRRWIINQTQPNCSGSVTVELAEPFHCSGNWAAHCFQGYPIVCALFPFSSERLRSVLIASLRS